VAIVTNNKTSGNDTMIRSLIDSPVAGLLLRWAR